MKKYLVIGNPVKHSLSPKLHNYWFKKNNIDAIYEKKLIKENDVEKLEYKEDTGKLVYSIEKKYDIENFNLFSYSYSYHFFWFIDIQRTWFNTYYFNNMGLLFF